MFKTLSKDPQVFMDWNWKTLEPYADDLKRRAVTQASLDEWVMDWSDLNRVVSEMFARLWVATTRDTADAELKTRFNSFLDETLTPSLVANQVFKEMLLSSGLKPAGFEIPLMNMRVEAEIYREENLPLLSEEKKLVNEYDEIIGAQTVEWEGQEVTPTQLLPVYLSPDRRRREKAWRLSMERRLVDRQRLNDLWVTMLDLRGRMARNAGYNDYRAYKWLELHRFDYTPEDCTTFQLAIEQVAVPASQRILRKTTATVGAELSQAMGPGC